MMNKFLVYCTIFVPLSAFADIQVGGENSPLKVYGIIDYGLNYSHSNVESSYSFQSGMDYASRIGLKLNYKLNDDFSIIGNVESWIDLKEMEFVRETPFARSEFIGVNSDTYGKLVYGRIMPPVAGALEELFATPFSPTSIAVQAYDLGFGAPTYDVRTSKSISYTTPKYNNSTLTIVYSPNQMVGEAPAVTNAKLYGALYIYDNGVNRISASYNELVSNNSVNYNNQILNDIKTKDYRALVQKKINKDLTILGTAAYLKPTSPNAVSAQVYGLILNYEKPKYSFKGAIYSRKVDKNNNSALIYAFGTNYHLNKHLDAYFRAEYIGNNSNATYTTNSIALEGQGDDPSTYGVGLKFFF